MGTYFKTEKPEKVLKEVKKELPVEYYAKNVKQDKNEKKRKTELSSPVAESAKSQFRRKANHYKSRG
jgi:predicted transcriptional regulator